MDIERMDFNIEIHRCANGYVVFLNRSFYADPTNRSMDGTYVFRTLDELFDWIRTIDAKMES